MLLVLCMSRSLTYILFSVALKIILKRLVKHSSQVLFLRLSIESFSSSSSSQFFFEIFSMIRTCWDFAIKVPFLQWVLWKWCVLRLCELCDCTSGYYKDELPSFEISFFSNFTFHFSILKLKILFNFFFL